MSTATKRTRSAGVKPAAKSQVKTGKAKTAPAPQPQLKPEKVTAEASTTTITKSNKNTYRVITGRFFWEGEIRNIGFEFDSDKDMSGSVDAGRLVRAD